MNGTKSSDKHTHTHSHSHTKTHKMGSLTSIKSFTESILRTLDTSMDRHLFTIVVFKGFLEGRHILETAFNLMCGIVSVCHHMYLCVCDLAYSCVIVFRCLDNQTL